MIAPHRSNRVRARTQDRRRLRRYERRWLVEPFFAWLQWQRRLLIRGCYTQNFLGFVEVATISILPNNLEMGSNQANFYSRNNAVAYV